MRRRASIATLAACALALSCGSQDGLVLPVSSVAAISISGAPTNGLLLLGDSATLAAVLLDASGKQVSRNVTWASMNTAVVAITNSGRLSALASGRTIITASSDGVVDSLELAVRVGITAPPNGATQATTTTVLGGRVTLMIPPAAIGAGTVLTVGPAEAAAPPTSSELVAGTAFVFGPEGTQFAKPVQLTLSFDPANVPLGDRAGLAIYLLNNGGWEEVPGSVPDLIGSVVSAAVTHFSTYAVLRRPPAVGMSIVAGNNQAAAAGAAVPIRPAVKVVDARGAPVPGISVTFAPGTGGGTAAGSTQLTDASGIASALSWTLGSVGTNTLVATAGALPSVTFTAQGTPPPSQQVATNLATIVHPTAVNTSVVFTRQPVVEVRDESGARVPSATNAVTAFIESGTGQLVGQTTVNAVDGVATFHDLGIVGVGLFRLEFRASTLRSALASPLQIDRIVTRLAVVTGPTCASAGVAFRTQPAVDLRDAADLRIPFSTNTVTATIVSGVGTLDGQTSVAAVDGRATFTDLSISGTGPFTLSFASSGLASVNSASFTVQSQPCGGAGATTRLAVLSQSTQMTSGRPGGSFTIHALDANGELDTDASGTVTIALASGSGTLKSPSSASLVGGVANFIWTQVDGSGPHLFLFTSAALSSATSAPVNLLQAAQRIVVTRAPSGSRAGVPLPTQPIVTVVDDAGLPVVTRSHEVIVGIGSTTADLAGLTGTTKVLTVNGVAAFTNLAVTRAATIALQFMSPSVPTAVFFWDIVITP